MEPADEFVRLWTRRARGVLSGKYNLSRYIEVGEGVEADLRSNLIWEIFPG